MYDELKNLQLGFLHPVPLQLVSKPGTLCMQLRRAIMLIGYQQKNPTVLVRYSKKCHGFPQADLLCAVL